MNYNKDQERVNQITKHNLEGTPVPAELFNIGVQIKKNYLYMSAKNRESCLTYFKKCVNPYIVDIGNSLKIYDMKIFLVIRNAILDADNFNVFALLYDDKDNMLGTLTYYDIQDNEHISSTKFNLNSFSSKMSPSEPKSIFLSFINRDINNSIQSFENNSSLEKVDNIVNSYYHFLKELDLKIEDEISLEIGKDFKLFCTHYITTPIKYDFDIDNFCETDIVRMLIFFKHITIQLVEEDLIPENIDEIKNLIKMNIY